MVAITIEGTRPFDLAIPTRGTHRLTLVCLSQIVGQGDSARERAKKLLTQSKHNRSAHGRTFTDFLLLNLGNPNQRAENLSDRGIQLTRPNPFHCCHSSGQQCHGNHDACPGHTSVSTAPELGQQQMSRPRQCLALQHGGCHSEAQLNNPQLSIGKDSRDSGRATARVASKTTHTYEVHTEKTNSARV